MNTKLVTSQTPTRGTIEPVTRAVVFRAKIVLLSIALVAAIFLVAVGSWPLKLAVVLAFVRGVFASDIAAFRNPRPAEGRKHLATVTGAPTPLGPRDAPAVGRPRVWMPRRIEYHLHSADSPSLVPAPSSTRGASVAARVRRRWAEAQVTDTGGEGQRA